MSASSAPGRRSGALAPPKSAAAAASAQLLPVSALASSTLICIFEWRVRQVYYDGYGSQRSEGPQGGKRRRASSVQR